ncbi:PREDICTED: nucleolin 2-like [Erythranthe guttata]|uniref:nucleolin 2-like n=1 Tax=Erythranthe guttata TaxID=4155 RepID=UPI00064DAF85|nr:PREDICTED: nucleolin 2-like [Erythranthe guttata]|eukprot:XP_012827995.1 PREDICTED: nucleolin 2-like [Erythranthe guttata]
MAAASSQHPASEDVVAHVPENAVAPTFSDNAPQSVVEDAAPYQDEEMPDFSGMSCAEHVDIPTVDAQDFATTVETSLPTPSAPNEDPLETLAEAAVQVDAPSSQAEEEEKSDDSSEVPLASFLKYLPPSESDSDSSEDSSQMEEYAAPPVASPEPAYIPDELEDSGEEEPSEDEELDLDGKDLSTPFEEFYANSHLKTPTVIDEDNYGDFTELTHSLAQITYHQSMVEMLQLALSDQKGGEQASHEVAGTSHPLDARGREHGVNEEEQRNEGEEEEDKESSGSSTSDGGAAADTEETLDILL